MSNAGGLVGDKRGRPCLQTLVSHHWVTNVVDFVLNTQSQSSRHWGRWVTNLVDKPCQQDLVSHHASNAFSKCLLLDCPCLEREKERERERERRHKVGHEVTCLKNRGFVCVYLQQNKKRRESREKNVTIGATRRNESSQWYKKPGYQIRCAEVVSLFSAE